MVVSACGGRVVSACCGRRAGGISVRRATVDANIVLLPGDGIGPEIVREARRVLDLVGAGRGHTFAVDEALIGGVAIDETGEALPDATLTKCLASNAVLLGCVGGPKWDGTPVRPEQGLLRIRKEMDLFANLRPILFFDELIGCSPLRPEIVKGVDFMVVRELIGGAYFGPRVEQTDDSPVAHDTIIYSVPEVERIVRLAAKIARTRGGHLCSVDKQNVLASSRLWRRTTQRVCDEEFPDVKLEHRLVDSCAMDIISNPRSFDVVVTENMFGDILTDEASVLAGSLGLLPSASIASDDGTKPGLYEPIHGSAPDIANMGIANPIGTILSAAMLLRMNLNLAEEADLVESAVRLALADGHRTADLLTATEKDAAVSTAGMGDAILSRLDALLQ